MGHEMSSRLCVGVCASVCMCACVCVLSDTHTQKKDGANRATQTEKGLGIN